MLRYKYFEKMYFGAVLVSPDNNLELSNSLMDGTSLTLRDNTACGLNSSWEVNRAAYVQASTDDRMREWWDGVAPRRSAHIGPLGLSLTS